MTVKVTFNDHTDDVISSMSDGGRKLIKALAFTTNAEVKKALLKGGRSGVEYTVPGTKTKYTASAPGEAPAPRTGELANSYRVKIVSNKESQVGSDVIQARHEFGLGRAAPRPHLRPANKKTMSTINKIIKKVYKDA